MSVNPTNAITNVKSVTTREATNSKVKNQAAPASASSEASSSTNVKLSPAAKVLLASQDDDVNMDKISRIKDAIASGELVVDTQKIANNLIKITIRDAAES